MSAPPFRLLILVLLIICVTASPLTPIAAPVPGQVLTSSTLSPTLSQVPVAITTSDDLAFSVSYVLPKPSAWTAIDMRLQDREGKTIVYQSEWVDGQIAGAQTAPLTMTLKKESLDPGVYSLRVDLKSNLASAGTVTGNATASIPIYQKDAAAVPIAFFVRVQTELSTDASGAFTTDPSKNTTVPDTVLSLSQLVMNESRVRLTLAIAPAMLEEWDRISRGGYTVSDGTTKTEVPAKSPTAEKYDLVLSTLREAVQTKRLEVAPLAYSDPDLSSLVDAGLGTDIETQYDRGVALTRSIVSTETAGCTLPADSALPPAAKDALVKHTFSWVVLDSQVAKVKETDPPRDLAGTVLAPASGAWRIDGLDPIGALVSDTEANLALEGNDVNGFLARALVQQTENAQSTPAAAHPLIATAVVSSESTGTVALDSLKTVLTQPWARLISSDEAAKTSRGTVALSPKAAEAAPEGFWRNVADARAQSEALLAIAEPDQKEAERATRNSLLAESSAWAGPGLSWHGEREGLSLAEDALEQAHSILDKITIKIEPVTLTKDAGEVPLVIANGTPYTLTVDVDILATSGLSISGPVPEQMKLYPNDNYITVPVKLDTNETAGNLSVDVRAKDEVLEHAAIRVNGSLLGRTIALVGIAIVLVVILIFIRRRVRSVEDNSENPVSD